MLIYYNYFLIKFNLMYISIKNVFFAILIFFISNKVISDDAFLRFLYSHSPSILLLHRKVICITNTTNIFNQSDFFQISYEFTSTFFINSLIDKYFILIDLVFQYKNELNINKHPSFKVIINFIYILLYFIKFLKVVLNILFYFLFNFILLIN